MEGLTATVSADALPPHIFQALLVDQTPECVESSSRLECPYALLVFAFKEQTDFRARAVGGVVAILLGLDGRELLGSEISSVGLSCGSNRVQGLARLDRCLMDVLQYAFVSGLNRLSGQRWAFRRVGHISQLQDRLEEDSDRDRAKYFC